MRGKPESSRWTAEIIEAIRTRVPIEGYRLLSEEFGFCQSSIRNQALKMGITSPKAQSQKRVLNKETIKEDYFLSWSPEVAYDLGYIRADGSIRNTLNCLDLRCKTTDESIILLLRGRIGSNHNFKRYPERIRDNGYVDKPQTRINLYNSSLARSLVDVHGILPRKSYFDNPYPSNIPDDLQGHHSRGYMDGDGGVSTKKTGMTHLYFIGGDLFINGIYDLLRDRLNVSERKIEQSRKKPRLFKVEWFRDDDLRKLYSFLYPPGDYPFLPRKRLKLEMALGI